MNAWSSQPNKTEKDTYLYLWAVANYIKVSKLQETKLNIEAEQNLASQDKCCLYLCAVICVCLRVCAWGVFVYMNFRVSVCMVSEVMTVVLTPTYTPTHAPTNARGCLFWLCLTVSDGWLTASADFCATKTAAIQLHTIHHSFCQSATTELATVCVLPPSLLQASRTALRQAGEAHTLTTPLPDFLEGERRGASKALT